MPNIIDSSGLKINTLRENIDQLTEGLRNIYGQDIILSSNSPDGQQVGITAQMATNALELLSSIYQSFDPNQAVGVQLDQRAALMGIRRRGATYTFVEVNVTVSQECTLIGLDEKMFFGDVSPETIQNLFSVRDTTGNIYYLANTSTVSPAVGGLPLVFRAAQIGNVSVTVGVINQIYTSGQYVVSVTNLSGALIEGSDGELDYSLRKRLLQSSTIRSQALTAALQAALNDIQFVEQAVVLENKTDLTDSDGIPPHSIWTIVEGGSDADIGTTIYSYLGMGVGQKETDNYFDVLSSQGVTDRMFFDRVAPVELVVDCKVYAPNLVISQESIDEIKNYIANNIKFSIYEGAQSAQIICLASSVMANLGINGFAQSATVSYGAIPPTSFLLPPDKKSKFVLTTGNITVTQSTEP